MVDPAPFRINDVTIEHNEAPDYLEQAHAVASCLELAASEDARANRQILVAAANAVGTLILLASQAHAKEREETNALWHTRGSALA
ncbi:hypothetical protein [Sphingomonas qomolangmaensis]|uniref:DUF3077 domain-containing protein n=1 Tax=Sphingomonas qomolangmaensis TaxID=2918765 RepID=A0ABY5LBZ7_9SPHN|nr:hypothetical protein [Sphingomonas qomolangmaensis]UUL83456.1 hypothetical protein NMP03_04295 [Sphingomonas qomolangmaensis]